MRCLAPTLNTITAIGSCFCFLVAEISCCLLSGNDSCNVSVIAVDVLENKVFSALLLTLSQFDLSLPDIGIKEL